MSYDFPDDYVHPPKKKPTLRERAADLYWRFVLWCTLDAKSKRLNAWGERQLYKTDEKNINEEKSK